MVRLFFAVSISFVLLYIVVYMVNFQCYSLLFVFHINYVEVKLAKAKRMVNYWDLFIKIRTIFIYLRFW